MARAAVVVRLVITRLVARALLGSTAAPGAAVIMPQAAAVVQNKLEKMPTPMVRHLVATVVKVSRTPIVARPLSMAVEAAATVTVAQDKVARARARDKVILANPARPIGAVAAAAFMERLQMAGLAARVSASFVI